MPSADSPALLLAASAMVGAWLSMVLWIVGNRLFHDARNRQLDRAARMLRDPRLEALPGSERMQATERVLRRLPLRSLETLMMTPLPAWARDACSARIARLRDPQRLLATARSGPARSRKWDYIAALSVLAHARHPDSHALLERALALEDPHVRRAAIGLLGDIGDRRAAQILIDGLQAAGTLHARIASQLDRFAVPIGDLLEPAAASTDAVVRAWAAQLMWRHAGSAGIAARLAELAHDPDPGVRKAAIQSLAEADAPLAARSARRMLHDEAPFVRAHAARTLTDADRDGAAADIAPLLADTDWWVRQGAKESLTRIGLPAMPHVLALLDSPDRFARNGAADVLQDIGAIALLLEQSRQADAEGTRAGALLQRIMQAGERSMVGTAARSHPSWQAPAVAATAAPGAPT